jgi:two-component system cell cycle sensor histidine kinase/response regulator CckA
MKCCAPSHNTPGSGAISVRRQTILLLDDDELLSSLVRRALEREGYQVLLAHDGTEALDIADQHRGSIALLLTDVIMQGINGIEVAKRLQRMRPELKILFMTGDDASNDGVQGGRVVPKPFSLQSLIAFVRNAIGC